MRNNDSQTRSAGGATKLVAIITAVFILLSVGFGAAVLTMDALDDANALVSLDGIGLSEGEVRYLASVYKATYMAALSSAGIGGVKDTDAFWSSTAADGKSYEEKLETGFSEYLRGMLAASRIFYQYSRYTSEDRAAVDKAVRERLTYTAEGSVARFNELSEKYGFTYDDFVSATAFIYRAQKGKLIVCGEDGASLSSVPEECREYLKEYTRVKVLFVRVADRLNEAGEVVSLGDAEKAEKAETIERIRIYIDNAKANLNDAMSPDAFDTFLRDASFSDSDSAFFNTGYYLHPSAEQTGYFAEAFPEVYKAAMELSVGEFGEAKWESGVAFLYRLEIDEDAYKDSNNLMFSDFYSDLADIFYPEMLAEVGAVAEFTELFEGVSVVDVPYNTDFVVTFSEE